MVSLVNRHDGLVGVVFLVCLARVVFVGGVNRPRDVFATRAFADDDENVVHLTPQWSNRWAALLDPGDDEGVRGGGVQRFQHRLRDLVFAVPNMGSVTRVLRPCVSVRCESNGWKLLASISIIRKLFP